MQSLMNAVFCGPTSFFALALLRQAVRLACLAAASLSAGVLAAAPAAPGAVVGDAAVLADAVVLAGAVLAAGGSFAAARADSSRQAAVAGTQVRMYLSPEMICSRIAGAAHRPDEARMKLA